MRHRKNTVKLGRSPAHREALLGSLVCSLIEAKRIKTTVSKAKAARCLAEKMVTLGKKGTIAARRNAAARLKQPQAVKVLFDSVAPSFADRNGGYTRVLKLGRRSSDGSEMAILEWVDFIEQGAKPSKTDKKAAVSEDADSAKPAKKPAKKKRATKAKKEDKS